MSRPTVYFKKGMLYHQEIVLFDFSPNVSLEALIEQHPATHFCDLQQRWFMTRNRQYLNDLYTILKNEGYRVDLQDVLPGKPLAIRLSAENEAICHAYRSYLIGLRMSESTVNTYTTFIEQLGRYLDQASIATTDLATLRDFILFSVQHKGYSISTHRQMVSAFKHLIVLYPHLKGVMEHIKRPKRSRFQPQVLSVEEVIHLLQVTRNLKHRFALGMLYSCGLRIGELLHMRLSHVDLLRRQVFVKDGKGRKDRHVGIAANMYPLIQNYLSTYKPQLLLIEGPGGGVYSQSSVRAFLRKSCRLAGITKKVTPHTLRHSYATHMIENGVGLRHVQELLGHSKPETTMLYTHIARKDLLEIKNPLDVAVQKLKSDKAHSNIRLSGDL